MKVSTLFLVVVLVVIGLFAALNWGVFMAPTTLSLGVASIEAPLGLVMLGFLAVLTALFLMFVVYVQASVVVETRRHARELKANRDLADQAEASRFTELRRFLEVELKKLADLDGESKLVLQTRLDQLDRSLRSAIEESGNSVAAYIGELEDLVEKRKDDQTRELPR